MEVGRQTNRFAVEQRASPTTSNTWGERHKKITEKSKDWTWEGGSSSATTYTYRNAFKQKPDASVTAPRTSVAAVQLKQIQNRSVIWKKKHSFIWEFKNLSEECYDLEKRKPLRAVFTRKKLIHSEGHPKRSFNNWEDTNFGDSFLNERFRSLMGIRGIALPDPNSVKTSSEALFSALEKQYNLARAFSHQAKGSGLGIASLRFPTLLG